MSNSTAVPSKTSRRADLLLNTAVRELADGRYEDAVPKLEQAAELYEETQSSLGRAMACYNLGVAALNAGEPDGAGGWFVIATRLFADAGWPVGVAMADAGASSASEITDAE